MPRLQAETPKADAYFGYTMGSGRLGGPLDALDDVVICAISEDENVMRDETGAAYVFMDANLAAPLFKPSRLIATPLSGDTLPPNGAQLGRLAVVIGNLRGEGFGNLLLIGCAGHVAEYPGVGTDVDGGSVEMYDYTSSAVPIPQRSIFAPLNPPGLVPTEVRVFGHSLALGDVTRDGLPDLVVGAPATTVTLFNKDCGPVIQKASPGLGRFYVLKGHADFYNDPHFAWLGVNAVEPRLGCEVRLDQDWGKEFGCDVATCNFTEDTAMEVLVGREDRNIDATIATPQLAPLGGSAYVFRGKYLHDLMLGLPFDPVSNPSGTLNRVNQPPWPDQPASQGGLDPAVPEYQVLRNPMGDLQPFGDNPQAPLWAGAFGWKVRNGGDLGSPFWKSPWLGGYDGVDTAVVYSEVCDYLGTGTLADPEVDEAGGVWFFHGAGDTGPVMVHDDRVAYADHLDAILIQRPLNVATPESDAHFGRGFARLDAWRASPEAEPAPAILIGELNATAAPPVGQGSQAGAAYLFRPPLPAPSQLGAGWAATWDNAWGSVVLLEPLAADVAEQGPAHHFAAAIEVLNYKPENVSEGQEFIISAREAAVKDAGGTLQEKAGRAYPFLQPPPAGGGP